MQPRWCAVSFSLGLLLTAGCRDAGTESGPPQVPVPSGTYSYAAYDSSGTAVISGWFTIAHIDSSAITGDWHFRAIGSPVNIGPHAGDGKLAGTLSGGVLQVNLQPNFADNNILLHGSTSSTGIEGTWTWISFIGPTNRGSFIAARP